MKALRWAVALVLVGGFACGGSDEDAATASVMPDVVGRKLDVALTEIKSAGFEDDVEIEGDGTFGVVNESNWTVCDQSPAAGKPIADPPQLTVDRSCEDGAAEDSEEQTTTSSSPEAEPEPTLTASTNDDLAALLADSDDCSDAIDAFASQYGGRSVEFDGSIAALNNHGNNETRYDILVRVGETVGPNFQFRDVGMADLHLTGPNVPDSIRVGDNLHVVARVEEYNADQCLLRLDPVSTEVR